KGEEVLSYINFQVVAECLFNSQPVVFVRNFYCQRFDRWEVILANLSGHRVRLTSDRRCQATAEPVGNRFLEHRRWRKSQIQKDNIAAFGKVFCTIAEGLKANNVGRRQGNGRFPSKCSRTDRASGNWWGGAVFPLYFAIIQRPTFLPFQ